MQFQELWVRAGALGKAGSIQRHRDKKGSGITRLLYTVMGSGGQFGMEVSFGSRLASDRGQIEWKRSVRMEVSFG